MGKDERKLIEISRRMGSPVPERIRNAPDLFNGLELFYEAFGALTTSRMLGQAAVGPIPYAAISGYCRDEGIFGRQREDVLYFIPRMDAAYMRWQTDKAAYEAEQAAAAREGK